MRQALDPFTGVLLAAIAVAVVWPAQGTVAEILGTVSTIAVGGLFFLHGAALARESVIAGIRHWRLHLVVVAMTFLVFPLLVLPLGALSVGWLPQALVLGFLYLGVLPSAVSSSIAYTAMAGGNVSAAVCSAALSNVFGMMATPFLITLIATTTAGDIAVGAALQDIVVQLLLPFAAGQLVRPWLGGSVDRHSRLAGRYDQAVIVLIVYTAFSQSVAHGLWQHTLAGTIVLALMLCAGLLAFMLGFAMVVARWLGFNRQDETAVVFCGSKKSLASGLPMANVLFAGNPALGLIILPIMIYNQLQVLVGAWLARRYARRMPADADSGLRE